MKFSLKRILCFFAFLLPFAGAGQYRFIENKGQWPESVAYRTDIPGGTCYLEPGGLLFDLRDQSTVDAVFASHSGSQSTATLPLMLQQHAYRLHFGGAAYAKPKGEKSFDTRYAYFIGSDQSKWKGGVSAFERIVYTEIYPSISAVVYGNNNLKYDFVVAPGGDPKSIILNYEGVKPKLEKSGNISLSTACGPVTETKPFAYQLIEGRIVQVVCGYIIENGSVKFEVGNYRADLELVIDPELIFSTYSGSTADNFGYTATFDAEGHLYSGSSVFGNGYPTTLGAYQTAWAGGEGAGSLAGTDIGISKFSIDGTSLIYSTYIGGSGDELPHSLITDSDGNLYILGTTGSANYPTTMGAFQTTFMGGEQTPLGGIGVFYANGADIVVSRLSATGSNLLSSTYVGGSNNDGTNTSPNLRFNYADEVRGEIELTAAGNVAIGSCTFSPNFPIPSNAFQPVKGAGQDGVFFILNPALTAIQAGTFFGGSGSDAIYSIDVSNPVNYVMAGGTNSTGLPSSAGAFQMNYAGGQADGFILSLNPTATGLQAMTYYGSPAYDQIYFVESDGNDFPHIYGQTQATGSTFIANAAYGIPNSGMLLTKFNPDLQSRVWSTVFGTGNGIPNLSPTAFSVDICNRVYLSGWGGIVNGQGSTTGMAVTDDALKATTDGSDFYLMVLESDASALSFASFYGGNSSAEHVDGGTSRFDRTGKIYQAVCAGCGSNDDFPIFPANAVSPTNNSFNCNLGVAKIDFDLPLAIADFTSSENCFPDLTVFTNTSNDFSGGSPSFTWFFPNGETSTETNPTYGFSGVGMFDVTLVINDPNSCNLTDTITKTVTVLPELVLEIADTISTCIDEPLELVALTNETATFFQWALDQDFTQIISQGATDSILTYSPLTTQTIYIRVDNGFCDITQAIHLAPLPALLLSFGDTTLCSVSEFVISYALSAGGLSQSTTWSPASTIISGQGTNDATFLTSEPIDIELSVTTTFGCMLNATIPIAVFPISLETNGDQLICEDTTVELIANSSGTADFFLWSSDPNFDLILNPASDSTISVSPGALSFYYIRAINGPCSLTDSVGVSLLSASTSVSSDRFICAGDSTQLLVINDFPGIALTHFWTPEALILSGQGSNSVWVLVPELTTFDVVSTSQDGCTTDNAITVFTSELGNLSIDATAEPTAIIAGQSSLLNALPNDPDLIYQWTPPQNLSSSFGSSTTATPPVTTTFRVNLLDVNALGTCEKSDSVTVFVYEEVCGDPSIFLPNAFSPNGDGSNDVLLLRGTNITSMHLAIHDRWGDIVFETSDQRSGWDGTFNGKLAAPAVFVYYLDVVCADGQDYSAKGNITLIR